MSVRAVFDCMIFLQAAGNPAGPAMACFTRLDAVGGTLCLSREVLAEVAEVLMRPELQRRFKRLTPQLVADFLDELQRKARMIEYVPRDFALPRDPTDEPYLNLAIASDSDYLVTWNVRHLTYLMRNDTPEGKAFRERYPKLQIVDPVEFLRTLADDG